MTDIWQPVILTVAPTGAYKGKQDHHALPITPEEIADTAAHCLDVGAAMIHLHVRDPEGRHSLDPSAYQDAIDAVVRKVGKNMVIQITSEAAKRFSPAQQMSAIRAVKPEAVSLAVRELVPDMASETEAALFFDWLSKERVAPQYILYSPHDLELYQDLVNREVIPATPHWLLFVLGKYRETLDSTPRDLLPFLQPHDHRIPWAVCAFGYQEHACGVCAATLGGHVRVGFENNLYLSDGSPADDNASLLAQMRDSLCTLGRPLGDADDLRAMMDHS